MNKEIQTEWVAALRSGDYVQGKGKLKTSDNQFCCLGVLCDIMSKKDPKKYGDWGSATHGGAVIFGQFPNIGAGTLPDSMRHDVGIGVGLEGALIRMNDGDIPFSEIATYIENEF